jgi:hypothetical protein
MLAFLCRRDAGTVGAGPVGHWHYRHGSLLDQPTVGIIPRRRIGKNGQGSQTVDLKAVLPGS